MSNRSTKRIEILTRRLKSRTNHKGEPMPGFNENVAALRAEISLLTEQVDNEKGDNDGE